jgi:hypothetical protein
VCYGTEKYQWPAKTETEGLLYVMVLKSADGRQKQEGSDKGEASGHLSRPEKHTRFYLRRNTQHSQSLGRSNIFGSFHTRKNSNMCCI